TAPEFTEINVGDSFDVMTGVSATDTEDGTLTVTADPTSVDTSVPGVVVITYTVEDSDGNTVSETQVVLVNDGNYVVGDTTLLYAEDFENLVSEVDTTDDGIKADAAVEVIDKFTGEDITATESLTIDKGSYTATAGEYDDVVITVTSDTAATKTVTATVTAGNAPVVTLDPKTVVIGVGDVVDYEAGVSVTDTEETFAVSDLAITKTVDSQTVGVYPVTYTIEDGDGNSTSETRVYVVKDDSIGVGETYIIQAYDFEKRVSEVDTADDAVITAGAVVVYDITTGSEVVVYPEITVDKGLYTNVVGEYSISYIITSDPAAVANITAKVVEGGLPTIVVPEFSEINVNDSFDLMAGVSATDPEDGTLSAEALTALDTTIAGVHVIEYQAVDDDGNIASGTQIVLVNDGTFIVAGDYILSASNYNIYYNDVNTADSAIASEASLEVYVLETGLKVSDPLSVVSVDSGSYSKTPGDYTITFTLNDSGATKEVVASVVTGALPVLDFEKFTEVQVGDNFDVLAGVTATDEEDGDLSVTANPTSIDLSAPGVKVITYTAVDSHGNETTETRVILVNDGSYVVGDKYLIKATDFTKKVSQVAVDANSVIDAAKVVVIDKETGLNVSAKSVVDVDFGSYQKAVGQYDIGFVVRDDAAAATSAVATVEADPVKPTPPPSNNLGCGVNAEWDEDKKMCICDSGYTTWEGAGIGCLTEFVPPVVTPTATPSATPEPTIEPTATPTVTPTATPIPTETPVEEVVDSAKTMSMANILLILLTVIAGAVTLSGRNEEDDNSNLVKFKVVNTLLPIVAVVAFIFTGGIQPVLGFVDGLTPLFAGIFGVSLVILGLERYSIKK
ncbi:MAG: immunoglobulin-like domain-containing protein, partial [Anaerorhabdus sp.]